MSLTVVRRSEMLHSDQTSSSSPERLNDLLDALHDIGRSLRYARGETIFEEADPAHHLYRVVRGTVRLCRYSAGGRRHIADFALPGDLFGVLTGEAQAVAAEAVTDAALIVYPRLHLDRLSEREPRLRANILAHLSTRTLTGELPSFPTNHDAMARFAAFVLRHAERTGAIETGMLDLAMSRQDIADHLGLPLETICRLVMRLRNEKVLGMAGAHQLVLRNVEALCELADGAMH